jgi:hypothetical protein
MESRRRGNFFSRASIGLLVTTLGVGLWQGYGAWLVSWVRSHVA